MVDYGVMYTINWIIQKHCYANLNLSQSSDSSNTNKWLNSCQFERQKFPTAALVAALQNTVASSVILYVLQAMLKIDCQVHSSQGTSTPLGEALYICSSLKLLYTSTIFYCWAIVILWASFSLKITAVVKWSMSSHSLFCPLTHRCTVWWWNDVRHELVWDKYRLLWRTDYHLTLPNSQFGRCSHGALTASLWAIHSGDYEIWTAANSSGTPALLTEIYIQFWSICHSSSRLRHAGIENNLSVFKLYVVKKKLSLSASPFLASACKFT